MKFQVGDRVSILVERNNMKEGEVGVVDAVHKDTSSYTIGFYAAEDCMIASARFYEEELAPYQSQAKPTLFEIGDIVKTLFDSPYMKAYAVGEVVAVYPETKSIVVKFDNENGGYPIFSPYRNIEVALIKKGH